MKQVSAGNALGLYISFPFCRSKCTYCNFASGVYPARDHDRYIDRVIEDMRNAGAWAERVGVELPRVIDSIYVGGGTPSLLEPQLVDQLFAAVRVEFVVAPDTEITVECAPGQLGETTLEALLAAGANRMSLGVQSFVDREARSTGRLHTRSVVLDDLRRLKAIGIPNISIDLIAGLAGQTMASWDESLQALIETAVPHASIYMLEIDQDSRLGRELLAGGARYHAGLVPSDDTIARMYESAIESLVRVGIQQYEISNFSLPGFESRHNLRYWQRRPYLGVGLDASSALREAGPATDGGSRRLMRATTTDRLESYLEGSDSPEITWLSSRQQHEEAWFLGLRLNTGVLIADLIREFGLELVSPALQVVEDLAQRGLVETNDHRVWLTPSGRLLSNEVFAQFIDCEAEPAETMR